MKKRMKTFHGDVMKAHGTSSRYLQESVARPTQHEEALTLSGVVSEQKAMKRRRGRGKVGKSNKESFSSVRNTKERRFHMAFVYDFGSLKLSVSWFILSILSPFLIYFQFTIFSSPNYTSSECKLFNFPCWKLVFSSPGIPTSMADVQSSVECFYGRRRRWTRLITCDGRKKVKRKTEWGIIDGLIKR